MPSPEKVHFAQPEKMTRRDSHGSRTSFSSDVARAIRAVERRRVPRLGIATLCVNPELPPKSDTVRITLLEQPPQAHNVALFDELHPNNIGPVLCSNGEVCQVFTNYITFNTVFSTELECGTVHRSFSDRRAAGYASTKPLECKYSVGTQRALAELHGSVCAQAMVFDMPHGRQVVELSRANGVYCNMYRKLVRKSDQFAELCAVIAVGVDIEILYVPPPETSPRVENFHYSRPHELFRAELVVVGELHAEVRHTLRIED